MDIHDDWGDPVFQMALKIDADRTAMSGLSNQDVATAIDAGLSGYSLGAIREQDRLIDIALRLRPSERTRLDDLFSLTTVNTKTNARMPLSQLARFEPQVVTPKIRRRDHERCITVRCDAGPGVLPSQIVDQLQRILPSTRSAPTVASAGAQAIAFPPGYRWEFGGEKFEQEKGFKSLSLALIVSFIAIFLALVLQFNSATQPLLVYGRRALRHRRAGSSVLLIFRSSFGFMAFLGVASLAGLIISHVIVLFDFIDERRKEGEPLRQAVVDAGLARLRPVLVTVLATVGGLIPLALEGGPLWEPMCYVQIVGMLVATVVTLVLVPVLYVAFVEDLQPGPVGAGRAKYHSGHQSRPRGMTRGGCAMNRTSKPQSTDALIGQLEATCRDLDAELAAAASVQRWLLPAAHLARAGHLCRGLVPDRSARERRLLRRRRTPRRALRRPDRRCQRSRRGRGRPHGHPAHHRPR